MKKVYKFATFYFILLSFLIIYMHYIGRDSHGIMLFWLNPILSSLVKTNFAKNVIQRGPIITCGSLTGYISVYWYFAHFITFVMYGLVIDLLLKIKGVHNHKK